MNLLANRRGRLTLFALLYLSEGGPIGFIWWALPTLLRAQGVEVAQITAVTATLVLPWTFKFLWAPFIDSVRGPHWGYREWIMSAQFAMGMAIIPLIWLEPATQFSWWWFLLLTHAFAAATQDVAIDALAIRVTPESERGILNGSMQAGLLAGRSLFGGGALIVASTLGHAWIIVALVMCIWFSLILVALAREPDRAVAPRYEFSEFATHLRAVLRLRSTWIGIAFALVAAAGFEATGQLAGPFLLDRGVVERDIGIFFGIAVVVAMLIGGLVGGKLSDRWGRARSAGIFLVGFASVILLLAAYDLSSAEPRAEVLLGLLAVLYLFIGLFVASSYALFMQLTDARLGGTQFSAYMSATNGCESWSAWAGGRLTAIGGYPLAFVVMSVVSLLSLPLLRFLGEKNSGQR